MDLRSLALIIGAAAVLMSLCHLYWSRRVFKTTKAQPPQKPLTYLEMADGYVVCALCSMPMDWEDSIPFSRKNLRACKDRAGCRSRRSKPDVGGAPS